METNKYLGMNSLGVLVDNIKREDSKILDSSKKYTDESGCLYDVAGAAVTAETNSKAYTDIEVGKIKVDVDKNTDDIAIIKDNYDKSKIGNLEDYWQYGETTTDIVRAINQNAEWVLANFEQHANKTNDIYNNKESEILYPSAKASYDLMKFVYDLVVPEIIYDDAIGFEASNNNAGETWHLTELDLSKYKRIKCYVCSGGDSDSNYSPEHIVEVHLDDRAKGSFGYFSATHTGHCQNNRNRLHIITFTVNAEKTAIQFQHSISLYGTAASTSSGGRRCYLIEGYLI